MEFIDDWNKIKPRKVPATIGTGEPAPLPALTRQNFEAFGEQVLTVHCYDDVDYRWVSVVWRTIIGPNVALQIGHALAAAVGADAVHFNSLRPQAVTFVLGPCTAAPPLLPIGRYGVRLAELEAAWSGAEVLAAPASEAIRS